MEVAVATSWTSRKGGGADVGGCRSPTPG